MISIEERTINVYYVREINEENELKLKDQRIIVKYIKMFVSNLMDHAQGVFTLTEKDMNIINKKGKRSLTIRSFPPRLILK